MNRRRVLKLIAIGALGLGPALATASGAGPVEHVRAFYGRYTSGDLNPGTYGPNVSENRRWHSEALASLLVWSLGRDGEMGWLEADPFVDGQDYQLSGLSTRLIRSSARRASVQVRFRNFGTPQSVRLELVREPAGWRIDDVANGTFPSLKAAMTRARAAETPRR